MKPGRIKVGSRVMLSIVLFSLVFPMVLPLAWMVVTSITPERLFYGEENLVFLPKEVRLRNYLDALTMLPFHRFFINTLAYSVLATFGSLLSCTVVAYGFARYEFYKRNLIFAVYLSTMILPGVVYMVPMFLMFRYFGWIDTYYPLIVPSFFALSAGTVFILRQKIKTIPNILFEAGRLEGFSAMHHIRYIIIPELLPLLGTIGTVHFVGHWNDLMGPLIYINSFEKKTLSLGLTYFQNQYITQMTLMMAASLIVSIPTMIVFLINQKKIIRGISLLNRYAN